MFFLLGIEKKTHEVVLADFFKGVQSIENKNRGGCLFFCYAFYKWLKQNNMPTDSFQIIQYDEENSCRITNNILWVSSKINNLPNHYSSPQSSSHFTWLYNGIEYDGYGEVRETSRHRRWERVDNEVLYGLNNSGLKINLVEEFCTKALNYSSWNDWFERNEAIEIISETLGIDLYDVWVE